MKKSAAVGLCGKRGGESLLSERGVSSYASAGHVLVSLLALLSNILSMIIIRIIISVILRFGSFIVSVLQSKVSTVIELSTARCSSTSENVSTAHFLREGWQQGTSP